MADILPKVASRLESTGVTVPDDVLVLASSFYELLFRWNRTVNLTALADGAEAIDRLIVEPLVAAAGLPAGGSLVDVGSGGGSPAIPMKLMRPALTLVMVEARAKKAAFLREASRHLGLRHVRVEARRLEELSRDSAWVGQATVVSVRAVRVDDALVRGLSAIAGGGAEIWSFGGERDRPEAMPGWRLDEARTLVPARGSVLRVYRRA